MDLKGKLAFVTGSTSGIGLRIAHTLAETGCDIIVHGFGEEKSIQDILESLKHKHKVNAEYIAGDLSKVEEMKNLASTVLERHSAVVDILINNAGITHYGSIEEFPEDKWDAIVIVNLTAPFHLIKEFLPTMKAKGWGRIVNMASAFSRVAAAKVTAYTAAKHGLVSLTKEVALKGISTGKMIATEQVAELVFFLVGSHASDQMTGADYLIDYGYTAS